MRDIIASKVHGKTGALRKPNGAPFPGNKSGMTLQVVAP
jgi:hypothetical protein